MAERVAKYTMIERCIDNGATISAHGVNDNKKILCHCTIRFSAASSDLNEMAMGLFRFLVCLISLITAYCNGIDRALARRRHNVFVGNGGAGCRRGFFPDRIVLTNWIFRLFKALYRGFTDLPLA